MPVQELPQHCCNARWRVFVTPSYAHRLTTPGGAARGRGLPFQVRLANGYHRDAPLNKKPQFSWDQCPEGQPTISLRAGDLATGPQNVPGAFEIRLAAALRSATFTVIA